MANDNKAVGPLASARLVTLIKAETAKKLDKTGGTLTGDLTISGAWLNVKSTDTGDGNISVDGSLVAGRGVSVLNDDKYVSLVCTGDNAAKIAGSGNNCARLAVGTPTGDNDAATKAYVDSKSAVATASANGLMSAADKKKLDSMYDIVATSMDGETFDITPAQLHEKLKGVPTTCAIKVVDTIIPLYRVQFPGDGSTKYIFQITKDNGVWEPNTRLAYTASAGGTYSGTIWGKSEYDLLASTPGILKFTGAAEAQFSGSKDVTIDIPTGEGAVRYDETQKLTSDQKSRACRNIGAVEQKGAWAEGTVMLLPSGNDGASIINITPGGKNNDYTLALDAGPENVPVRVSGIETPTDAQTDYAANVAYVKAKIAEVAASGGVIVDTAMSGTSTTPVQNKVIKQYVDDHAADGAVLYTAQTLTFEQQKQARKNIEAVDSVWPTITGGVSLCPEHITDSNTAVHATTTTVSADDFTLTLDGGPEDAPVRVRGIRTPTDTDANAAATVEYVLGKALPAVTTADNGKILKVVNGAWQAVSPD